MSLSAPWTTRSRIAGIPRTRTLPPSFGISSRRFRSGRYVRATSSSRSCSRNASTPPASMASNVTPSIPGAPLFFLASVVGLAQRLQLADVDVQAPEPPGLVSLRLDVDPPPQVLQIDGRLCHLAPASRVGGGVAEQQGPFAPRALPRLVATAGPSATLSPSADFPGSPVIRPTWLRRFRGGTRRASPVARRVLVTVPSLPPRRSVPPRQPDCDGPCCLRPHGCGLGLRGFALSGPPLRSLALRPGDSLTIPRMALSMGFRSSVSLLPAIQATGLLALTPAGLTPAEHVSLRWTHDG